MKEKEITEVKKKGMNKKTKFNILAIICIIIFAISLSPVSLQNDTFYTIKIGEHIEENGIDMMDPFSWHEDLSYTYPHWLYDYMIYKIDSVGGMFGIYLSTVIFACILGIVLYLTASKLSKNQVISFFITMAVLYLLRNFIAARAQLISYILFILAILFIEQFMESKTKRKYLYVFGLMIVSLLLANIHLAVWPFFFVLFLPYLAEYIIAIISDSNIIKRIAIKNCKTGITDLINRNSKLEKLKDKEEKIKSNKLKIEKYETKILTYETNIEKDNIKREKRRKNPYRIIVNKKPNAKWLIVIMLLCVLMGFLTPLGDTPFTYLPNQLLGNTTESISEHLPLTLIQSKDLLCVLVILFAMLIFTDVKIELADLFMIGGLLFLTFSSRRQMSLFILIGSITFIRLITVLLKKYDKDGIKNARNILTDNIVMILTITIVLIAGISILKPKVQHEFIPEDSYPVAAAEYIKNNIDMKNMKLYNEYNYGSYLLYKDIPVFIDSRADLYAPEFNKDCSVFSDFMDISSLGKYYEDKFYDYGITHLIMYKNAKINMFISRDDDYKELYSDDKFVIYERNK